MGTAYTPGLTVNGRALVRKTRRLPLQGEVLVQVGEEVAPEAIIARTELPGAITLLRAADKLGISGEELGELLECEIGDQVEAGQLLAETHGLFGRFLKNRLLSPVAGTVETITPQTGNVGIRHAPRLVELDAYVRGEVVEVLPGNGAVIETRGALVQGIFGIGGERRGTLQLLPAADPRQVGEGRGSVLVTSGRATVELYRVAAEAGAVGLVAGSVDDRTIGQILGYEIGVAITGEEKIPLALIVTEGFGEVEMAQRTWELLSSLADREASISGATQIRAGVIRPEIIVPDLGLSPEDIVVTTAEAQQLVEGIQVRLIREPYFGLLGKVTALPSEPVEIATGAEVRVVNARLEDGREVQIPRSNVEIVV